METPLHLPVEREVTVMFGDGWPLERASYLLLVKSRTAQQPGEEIAPGDLAGAHPPVTGERTANLDLQPLRLLLADQQLFMLLGCTDDRIVQLIAANLDRVSDDKAAQGRHRDLARAAANVEDQRANRVGHRQVGADRSRKGLIDQSSMGGTRSA